MCVCVAVRAYRVRVFVPPMHLGLVRTRLNEVTPTITRDMGMCVCVCVCQYSVCVCVHTHLCDWQAQTVCDVLINHIDSLLLR